MKKIGIIGGSGLEKLDLFTNKKEINHSTQYGSPSSTIFSGIIDENEIMIISRHGRRHNIPPTQVNNKANILALKQLGCSHIIATTACGSLRENIKRGDMVILDQFIDFTRHREITYTKKFEDDEPVHTPMAEPFDEILRKHLCDCAESLQLSHHKKGTVVTIEGPRFSTRAESNMFRIWGADVINMSTAPECALANEAGIPYAAIALSTDYDCWKTDEAPVTWEEVLKVFQKNVENVTKLLLLAISKI
ncbi:MAG TPA: S-methyl-5'-thioadenosine phosphorylase [Bacteroidales bacterium]|nr:S-methyl-5'-thioadenosine phosphorylase [Bacteroidales bacterium]HPS18315.1 S-methyl-5'-thioadenosine phosphorylase [Bacteroidales bacterium]